MIDWEIVAKSNGMTLDEFEHEIFIVAATLGALRIDGSGNDIKAVRFKTSDKNGGIVVMVSRD